MFLASSYEERLKSMVLREEFFPLMEDVKNSVAVMTKAANGNISPTSTRAAYIPIFYPFYSTQFSGEVYIKFLCLHVSFITILCLLPS